MIDIPDDLTKTVAEALRCRATWFRDGTGHDPDSIGALNATANQLDELADRIGDAVVPNGSDALLAPGQLRVLAAVAQAAVKDVAPYTTNSGIPAWYAQRVGRMLARDSFVAELVPQVLTELSRVTAELSAERATDIEQRRTLRALRAARAELRNIMHNVMRAGEQALLQIERLGANAQLAAEHQTAIAAGK